MGGPGARWAARLRTRIAAAVARTVQSSDALWRPADAAEHAGRFALLGFDFAVDFAGAPWLLEVNASPDLATACAGGAAAALSARLLGGLGELLAQRLRAPADGALPAGSGFEVALGLGRSVALHHRSSTLYQIH